MTVLVRDREGVLYIGIAKWRGALEVPPPSCAALHFRYLVNSAIILVGFLIPIGALVLIDWRLRKR